MRTHVVRAGLYCRISDDRVGGGLGVERQRLDCVKLADRLGWQIADTFTDNDISAYSGRRRPQYERLLGAIAARQIDAVVTWHPDRLNRSPLELERLIDLLERNHVLLQSVTAGLVDLGTPSGRAVARTLGAWARYESEHKAERIRAKKLELALAGQVNYSHYRPYGYGEDRATIVPEEAKVVREMMRRYLGGERAADISIDLNRRDIATSMGNHWAPSGIERILTSARIAGWRAEPVRSASLRAAPFLARGVWDAIVSRADVERARDLREDVTRRPGSARQHLLPDFATCGMCGGPLSRSRSAAQPRMQYRCQASSLALEPPCGRIVMDLPSAEAAVLAQLIDAITAGLAARIVSRGRALLDPAGDQLRELEHRARAVQLDYDDGRIARRTWEALGCRIGRAAELAEGVLADQPTMADVVSIAEYPERFPSLWRRTTIRRRRALLRLFVQRMVILPAISEDRRLRRPAERIAISWRA
jgi:site-specific DNA recombinase